MPVVIDQMSEEPIYRQIGSQVIEDIATGELSVGDPLPSVRSLARDLGVNLHTVNKAYAVLRDEGYVIMRGRSGAFVANTGGASSRRFSAEQNQLMARELLRLAVAYRARGGSESGFVEEAARQARIAFLAGEPSGKGDGTNER
jgi:DNA-binding transcriptional regulator YhcF (GntR family)